MSENDIERLQEVLRDFAKERDWEQFHSPKNLIMALMGEVGELSEIFQWLTDSEASHLEGKVKNRAREEIADVLLYLLRLSDVLDIDLIEAAHDKLEVNRQKYPVAVFKGSSAKYNEIKD
ncbi:nucleotide pyrophosphohydrolase [Vibrio coralliirubri]|uniref:nucleotide pyrophosphohydrolase n=1 Tax=Vibrio coralliirubri TaxID=1516159 RepID=UPI000EFD5569|nr:nucleotide pyrophosphohydrolase [Vibrio coralliirubri]